MQLIQYEATTEKVLKRPLLIVPPWIKKFYILDLNPEKSFIKWAVDQGHTVFIISWVNPDESLAGKNFEDYMHEGIFEALLSEGRMEVSSTKLDLSAIAIPIYHLAAREDHIAPPRSVFTGSGCFGGPVTFVLAGSGHIAGVINPPAKGRYQYWTGGAPEGTLEAWLEGAEEHPGSWWPHWQAWVEAQGRRRVSARAVGGGGLDPIEDAPGSYVRVQ